MAMTPLETEGAAQLRGPDADLWRTLAAWLWMTYLLLRDRRRPLVAVLTSTVSARLTVRAG